MYAGSYSYYFKHTLYAHASNGWKSFQACYLSNVAILPLGGKFKMWNFFKQHLFLPDVWNFVIKYYFIPTLAAWLQKIEKLNISLPIRMVLDTLYVDRNTIQGALRKNFVLSLSLI